MGARPALIPVFLFAVSFSVLSTSALAIDVMELTSVTTSPGASVTLTVLLTHDGQAQGFQTAITYDSTILTLTGVDTTGLDVETAVNGDIEFFFTSIDPNVLPGLGWAASAAVFDTTPPFDGQTLPPGVQQSIIACHFDTPDDDSLLGGCSPVNLSDGYGPPPGINNIISVGNGSVYPDLVSGQICFVVGQVFVRGDTNQDENVDIADGIFLLQYMFVGGPAPLCFDAGDANDDEVLDISDFIMLMTYQFLGGPPPAPPFPDCGIDPSGAGLDCDLFAQCGTTIQTPEVTSLTPPMGTPLGGDLINVNGNNFTADTTVRFGGTAATSVVFVSPSVLLAVTPAHAAGVVPVSVTNSSGTSQLENAFTFREPPAISTVEPNTGSSSGGDLVTISGSNFTSDSEVLFGTEPAQSVEYCSPTELRAMTPVGDPGTEDVRVENDNGTAILPDGYMYIDAPAPEAVTPSTGGAAGGDTVTITGSFFTADCTVDFGGVAASSVTFVSETELTVVTPAHAVGVVDVTVTNLNGPGTLVGGFTFQ